MIRRPPRSTLDRSSAASDVYKRQVENLIGKIQYNSFHIFNCYGLKVYEQNESADQINSKFEFDVSNLKNGTYFLSLLSEGIETKTYVFQVIH